MHAEIESDQPVRVWVCGCDSDAHWLPGYERAQSRREADVLFLTGGVDIHPAIYGSTKGPMFQAPDVSRDMNEIKWFHEAVAFGQRIVGVCRGAQMICALNGGKLVQHQDNPGHRHELRTLFFDGKINDEYKTLEINSSHHQAAHPFNLEKDKDYKILGYSVGHCTFHRDADGNEMHEEPGLMEVEDVWYPKTRSLGIQCHPEWMWNLVKSKTPNCEKERETILHYRSLFRWFMSQK
jgi:GMP synthase-like glutamine amidotransferase